MGDNSLLNNKCVAFFQQKEEIMRAIMGHSSNETAARWHGNGGVHRKGGGDRGSRHTVKKASVSGGHRGCGAVRSSRPMPTKVSHGTRQAIPVQKRKVYCHSLQNQSMTILNKATFGTKPENVIDCNHLRAARVGVPQPLPSLSFMQGTTVDVLCQLRQCNPQAKMGALIMASSTLAFDIQRDGQDYDTKKGVDVERLHRNRMAQELGTVICFPGIAQSAFDAGIVLPNGGIDGKGPVVASRMSTVPHLSNVRIEGRGPFELTRGMRNGLRLIQGERGPTLNGHNLYINEYNLVCNDRGEPIKFPRPIAYLNDAGEVERRPDHLTKLAFIRGEFRYVNDYQSLYCTEDVTPSTGYVLRNQKLQYNSEGIPLGRHAFDVDLVFLAGPSLSGSADEQGSRRLCRNQALMAGCRTFEEAENTILNLREKAVRIFGDKGSDIVNAMKIVMYSDVPYAQLDAWLNGDRFAFDFGAELRKAHERYMEQMVEICQKQLLGAMYAGDNILVIGTLGTGVFGNDPMDVADAYKIACMRLANAGYVLPQIVCADTDATKGSLFEQRIRS